MNGTPKKNLFNNDSTENTDSNIIDTSKSTTCQSGTKQNGSLPRRDSLNDIEDEDEENPFFDFHSESKDAEEIYTEAMMEELKQLQVSITCELGKVDWVSDLYFPSIVAIVCCYELVWFYEKEVVLY